MSDERRCWKIVVSGGARLVLPADLLDTGLRDYERTAGNRGVYVLRRVEGDLAHFLLLTLWESWDAIRAFAGNDPEKARYYPEDERFLLELEPTVTHYEVLEAS